ncbi:MAG: folate-binding protein YgfZ [Acidimicrobiia bacterium]|nr:folate-binding protein YgfZ [Acidimicrobiia bacterium]MYB25410.1 folate-binding protein YgfZ [Acidimicrobiia bacterium]
MTDSARYRGDYEALRHGAGAVTAARDVLEVTGADAASFLQGQLSQDVAALVTGEAAPSLLLQPDGKLHCLLRVSRRGEDRFVCDLAAGLGEAARERLERFKLRVDVELRLLRLTMLAVRGAAAPPPPLEAAEQDSDASTPVVVGPVSWGSVAGWDLVAEEVAIPDGVRLCGPEALEAVRIEAGVPAAQRELTEGLIPAEAGITVETVSFTKGCFVGQELVARIDSRGGNTPRRLRGVVVGDAAPPPVGAELTDADGSTVGRVTSSAYSPGLEAAVALAYVHRRLEPPAEARLAGSDGLPGEIRTLPLLG